MNTIVLTSKQANKIKRALKMLEEVREEVALSPENKVSEDGGINWYLEDCGGLYLMNGPSHSGYQEGDNLQNVIELFDFEYASGGGW